jgi:hypothetical protein
MNSSSQSVDSTLAGLRAIRELLSDPARWCKGSWARDVAGKKIGPSQEGACRWCLDGAVLTLAGDYQDVEVALNKAAASLKFPTGYIHLNDHPTTDHATVLACIDTAIAQTAISAPDEEQL